MYYAFLYAIRYVDGEASTGVNQIYVYIPDNEVHGGNMGPTWDLSAPDGPHVGFMNLAIRDDEDEREHIGDEEM